MNRCMIPDCDHQDKQIKIKYIDHRLSVKTSRMTPPIYACSKCVEKIEESYLNVEYKGPIQSKVVIIKQICGLNQIFAGCQMMGCNEIASFLSYEQAGINRGLYICKKCNGNKNSTGLIYTLLNPFPEYGVKMEQKDVDKICLLIGSVFCACLEELEKIAESTRQNEDSKNKIPLLQKFESFAHVCKLLIFLLIGNSEGNTLIYEINFSDDLDKAWVYKIFESSLRACALIYLFKNVNSLLLINKFIIFSLKRLIISLQLKYNDCFEEIISKQSPNEDDLIFYSFKFLISSSLLYFDIGFFDWFRKWLVENLIEIAQTTRKIRTYYRNNDSAHNDNKSPTIKIFYRSIKNLIKESDSKFKGDKSCYIFLLGDFYKDRDMNFRTISLAFVSTLIMAKVQFPFQELISYLRRYLMSVDQFENEIDTDLDSVVFKMYNSSYACSNCNKGFVKRKKTAVNYCCEEMQNLLIPLIYDANLKRKFISIIILDLFLQKVKIFEFIENEKFCISPIVLTAICDFLFTCLIFYFSDSGLGSNLDQSLLFFSLNCQLLSLIKKYYQKTNKTSQINFKYGPIYIKYGKNLNLYTYILLIIYNFSISKWEFLKFGLILNESS